MYYRDIEQYQYLTRKPETNDGDYIMIVTVVMAVLINVYFGVAYGMRYQDSVTTQSVEAYAHLPPIGYCK